MRSLSSLRALWQLASLPHQSTDSSPSLPSSWQGGSRTRECACVCVYVCVCACVLVHMCWGKHRKGRLDSRKLHTALIGTLARDTVSLTSAFICHTHCLQVMSTSYFSVTQLNKLPIQPQGHQCRQQKWKERKKW